MTQQALLDATSTKLNSIRESIIEGSRIVARPAEKHTYESISCAASQLRQALKELDEISGILIADHYLRTAGL